jgi:hypothetical protein
MKNENESRNLNWNKEELFESAESIGEHCNWGCIKEYEVPESKKLEFAIQMQLANIEDGAHNGLYIETSRDEYLKFLYEIYSKLMNEGLKWCDN